MDVLACWCFTPSPTGKIRRRSCPERSSSLASTAVASSRHHPHHTRRAAAVVLASVVVVTAATVTKAAAAAATVLHHRLLRILGKPRCCRAKWRPYPEPSSPVDAGRAVTSSSPTRWRRGRIHSPRPHSTSELSLHPTVQPPPLTTNVCTYKARVYHSQAPL